VVRDKAITVEGFKEPDVTVTTRAEGKGKRCSKPREFDCLFARDNARRAQEFADNKAEISKTNE
jgi:hypothetical protein